MFGRTCASGARSAVEPRMAVVGDRVRGISTHAKYAFCEGVITEVTNSGRVKVLFKGEQKSSYAMKRTSVELLYPILSAEQR